MKTLLFLLFFPLCCSAQHFSRLSRVIVAGTSSGGATVDTSYEALYYTPILSVQYNPLRPNKKVTLGGDLSFFMNGVPVSSSGNVRFILVTGSENLQVNGIQNTTVPIVPGAFNETYQNILAILNWN